VVISEVRLAAVESLCRLGLRSTPFARHTQDFLVDMFNDEIEEVRLGAILALSKLAEYLCLRDDQVEIITSVLKVRCLLAATTSYYILATIYYLLATTY